MRKIFLNLKAVNEAKKEQGTIDLMASKLTVNIFKIFATNTTKG